MSSHPSSVARCGLENPAITQNACAMNGALRVLAEAAQDGTFVPVPREFLLRLLEGAPTPPVEEKEDRLLTAKQAAARLGVSKEWIYRNKNRLPVVQMGRILRYSSRGLNRYQSRRTRGSG